MKTSKIQVAPVPEEEKCKMCLRLLNAERRASIAEEGLYTAYMMGYAAGRRLSQVERAIPVDEQRHRTEAAFSKKLGTKENEWDQH